MKDVYKSSETRLEIAEEKKKLISRFPFFTALSSYLSVSLSAASVRAGACAPRDEKLRDLITGPVPFAKIIVRVTSFSSTIIYLFFFHSRPFQFRLRMFVARGTARPAFIRDFAFVRITRLWATFRDWK